MELVVKDRGIDYQFGQLSHSQFARETYVVHPEGNGVKLRINKAPLCGEEEAPTW